MDRRDLEHIEAFLGMVGKTTLFEYYELPSDADNAEMEASIRKRRSWAQGQQANPKYRNEALWLIRHNALVRRVLMEERDAYIAEVSSRTQSEKLKVLSTFIEGVLSSGVLTRKSEEAILEQGRAHGLDDAVITARVDDLLESTGAQREVDPSEDIGGFEEAEGEFLDFYKVLDVTPDADTATIEQAHREKYRWARNLKDKDRVALIYAQLDAAWRVLKDPVKRAAYDASWRARQQGYAVSSDVELMGFLPGEVVDPGAPTDQVPTEPAALTPPVAPPAPPQPAPPAVTAPTPPLGVPAPPVPNLPRPNAPSINRPVPPAAPQPKPPSVEAISGRTIGSGQQVKPARRTPRLAIASPELVVIKVGRKPVTHKIIVKNAGKGKMPGRVTSDRDWLTVSQPRLDADALQQEIEVVIQPGGMPRSKGVALVTVVTDHGERRAITLRIERQAPPVPLIVGAVALALLILIAAVFALRALSKGEGPPASSNLELRLDPSSDLVKLDGQDIGRGPRLLVTEGLRAGQKVRVQVELDGFTPLTRDITLTSEPATLAELELELSEPIGGRPATDGDIPKINAEMAGRAIGSQLDGVRDCMKDNLQDKPGFTAELVVDIFVNSMGRLVGVDVKSENYESADVLPCVKRQLRAVKFPTVDGAAFGAVYNHTFTATVTSGSG